MHVVSKNGFVLELLFPPLEIQNIPRALKLQGELGQETMDWTRFLQHLDLSFL